MDLKGLQRSFGAQDVVVFEEKWVPKKVFFFFNYLTINRNNRIYADESNPVENSGCSMFSSYDYLIK